MVQIIGQQQPTILCPDCSQEFDGGPRWKRFRQQDGSWALVHSCPSERQMRVGVTLEAVVLDTGVGPPIHLEPKDAVHIGQTLCVQAERCLKMQAAARQKEDTDGEGPDAGRVDRDSAGPEVPAAEPAAVRPLDEDRQS